MNRPGRRLAVALACLASTCIVAAPSSSATTSIDEPRWSPPDGALPDAPSAMYLEDLPRGAYPGAVYRATNERADLSASLVPGRVWLSSRGDTDWSLGFQISGDAPSPGVLVFEEDTGPAISFGQDGSGCSDGSGWVEIIRADLVDGVLQHLEASFEHSCNTNGGPRIHRGAFRWSIDAPPGTPNPIEAPSDLWAPPPGAVPDEGTYLYIEPGSPAFPDGHLVVGNVLTALQQGPSPDSLWGQSWSFRAPTPSGSLGAGFQAGRHDPLLRAGLYEGLRSTNHNPVTGGIDAVLSGGSCSGGGWFAIDEISRVGHHIVRLAARFEHRCGPDDAPVRGAVSWTSTPQITSVHPAQGIARGGTTVTVEGRDLVEVSTVTVGGVEAEIVGRYHDALRFVTPELPVGSHDIEIDAVGGRAVGTGALGFTATPNTPGLPQDVTYAPSAAAALIAWTPPTDIGASAITGVRVDLYRWSNQADAPPIRTRLMAAEDTLTYWTQLEPYATYRVGITYLNAEGDGATHLTPYFRIPEVDIEPFDEVPTLVTQQYVDFAGRVPSAAERSTAVAAIREGQVLPNAWVASMRNRPEWGGVRAPATRLYAAYFGRLPDGGGLTYWAGRLRSGTTLAKVSATFAASSEFRRTYGSLSNGQFVDLVYRNVLHRTADPGGRTYWIRKLNAGTSRGAVMASFSESSEHVRTMMPTVDAVLLYTGMLRRVPTAAELGAAAPSGQPSDRAARAAVDPAALAQQLLRSEAYAARF